MTGPTAETGIQSFAAGVSAIVLALLGVPLLGIIWGTIGAVSVMVFTPTETRVNAIASVILGGLIGAAGGQAISDIGEKFISALGTQATLVVASLIVGAGSKILLAAAIERMRSFIENGNKQ